MARAPDTPAFVVEHDVIDEHARMALSQAIAQSNLLGDSQLTGGFDATRGFGVVCHRDAIDDALRHAPFLRPFLDIALDERRVRLLRPSSVFERAGEALFGAINALYVNVLVVPPGAAVARHTDCTIGTTDDDERALVPRIVCALYVDVPSDMRGGVLRLFRACQRAKHKHNESGQRSWHGSFDDDVCVGEVTPRQGSVVAFDGRLAHEVTTQVSSSPRVSCVCELYRLPRERLRRLPRVRVQSRGFADVLARLRR